MQRIRLLALVSLGPAVASLAAHAGGVARTDEAPMMTGSNTKATEALLTVGEHVDDPMGGLYQFTGIPDGIGAMVVDAATARIFVNHEFSPGAGTPWTLENGTVMPDGARVSSFDLDRATRNVNGGCLAIRRIVDWTGTEITEDNRAEFGVLARLCSSALFGAAEGFHDDVYFTGEETGGGRQFALDVATGTLYELAYFGNGAWENVAVYPTVNTVAEGWTVMLLADDAPGRPAYLYVGRQDPGSPDFLERNGLVHGTLHAFKTFSGANTNTEFNGTGSVVSGTWIELVSNDPTIDDLENQNNLVAEAGSKGAFFFSRPEDVDYDATDPNAGRAVMVSTGRVMNLGDIDGDGEDDLVDDPWGTTYLLTVDLENVGVRTMTGQMKVLYDGNEPGNQDFGLRSPDNLDWAADGLIYVQEDRSVGGFGADSGREASIWALDPERGVVYQVAEMDRSAVPNGQTDGDPDDLGNWESSGILDVSTLFGLAPASLFILDVQAHSLGGGVIESDGLVEGGQLLYLHVGTVARTSLAPMMAGREGNGIEALLTVGESVAKPGGGTHQLTGIPDGIGAMGWNGDTVRIFVNHEFPGGNGTPWTLANGTVMPDGARVSFFDVYRDSRTIRTGGQAIQWIVDWQGNVIDNANRAEFGVLNRLCSSSLFGPTDGLGDSIYFTGEETGGGRQFALDTSSGTLYELAYFGNGAWENVTLLPTVGTPVENKVAMLLADDAPGRPLYLYVGEKDVAADDFLVRNGLVGGQLYAFVAYGRINTNEEFRGTGNVVNGYWVELESNDPTIDDLENQNNLIAEAASKGAFFFSRPEDLAHNPVDTSSGEAVFASTGRVTNLGDIDGDGVDDRIDDPWGTTYIVTLDLASLDASTPTGQLRILYDGNDEGNRDFGIRSPDNLDWADDGYIYIQEDRSVGGFGADSGREASIWRIDGDGTEVTHVAEMDRGAVPPGMTDAEPNDLGNWESSGILDVSTLFGDEPGTLFIFDVQAHSLGGGIVEFDALVEGGQLLFLSANPVPSCRADVDDNGVVEFADLLIVLANWGPCPGEGQCFGDVDASGNVDFADILLVLSSWGVCNG